MPVMHGGKSSGWKPCTTEKQNVVNVASAKDIFAESVRTVASLANVKAHLRGTIACLK